MLSWCGCFKAPGSPPGYDVCDHTTVSQACFSLGIASGPLCSATRGALTGMKSASWALAPHIRDLNVSKSSAYACLQADDRRFKEELGRVIEMDIWDSAKAVAAERLKSARQQLTGLDSEARVREELLATVQRQVSLCPSPSLLHTS